MSLEANHNDRGGHGVQARPEQARGGGMLGFWLPAARPATITKCCSREQAEHIKMWIAPAHVPAVAPIDVRTIDNVTREKFTSSGVKDSSVGYISNRLSLRSTFMNDIADLKCACNEFRLYPLANWIRLSKDGVFQSNLKRGCTSGNGEQTDRWHELSIFMRYGYPAFAVRNRTYHAICHMVHRALLLTWVGPPPSPGFRALHKDGNKLNFSLENLYWGKAARMNTRGEKHWRSKLTAAQRLEIKLARSQGVKLKVLAAKYGVSMRRSFHRSASLEQQTGARPLSSLPSTSGSPNSGQVG